MLRTKRAWLLLAAGQVLPELGQLLGKQREQNPSAAPLGARVSGRNLGHQGGTLGTAERSGSGPSLCRRRLCRGLEQPLAGGRGAGSLGVAGEGQ